MGFIHGPMEGNMKAIIKTIESMEMGLTLGQMGVGIRESGKTIKDMEEGNISSIKTI